jgi:hypothetical protein
MYSVFWDIKGRPTMNNEEMALPEWLRQAKEELAVFKGMSCVELQVYLERHWPILDDGDRTYLTSLAAHKGCREGAPYLLRQLKADDPSARWRALSGLEELGCREYRQYFVDLYLNDPVEDVRRNALLYLSTLFRNERDAEILRLALAAWDNPSSSLALRLTAGAAMMYQLDIPHDEWGAPAWWDEEEADLQHPSILRAIEETREILAHGT